MQTRARPRESPPRHANLLARAMSPSAIALLGATATFGVLTDVERSALPAWCQGVSVKRIDDWFGSGGSGLKPLRFAQWDHPSEGHHQFNHGLYKGLTKILPVGAIAVDIGAHGGDTTLPISLATRGGRTFAFEMGPPYAMLRCNVDLNPSLHIETHALAVSDRDGEVMYESGCGGCNGGITSNSLVAKGRAKSTRLSSILPTSALANISFIKIDTEGHDMVILRDLKPLIQRSFPKILVEWFKPFRASPECSESSMRLFDAIDFLGYKALAVTGLDVAAALRKVKVVKPTREKGQWLCLGHGDTQDLLLWPPNHPLPTPQGTLATPPPSHGSMLGLLG